MTLFVEELFEDVQLLIARARKHEAEFEALFAGHGGAGWWRIDEQAVAGGFRYTLVVECERLKGLKPIAADLCNNLIHSLDQMIGALTRANGFDNSGRLQFPWKLENAEFDRALSKIEKHIGVEAADAIRRSREECRPALEIAHEAKEISNSGKHWALVPSSASVPAVAVHRPGAQQIFNLPPDTIEEQLYYTFYEGSERLGQHPISVVLGLRFDGIGHDQVSPGAVFGSAFHYVETVVRNTAACGAVEAAAEEHFRRTC